MWETPGFCSSHTQAWVEAAGVTVLLLQVLEFPMQLPGIPKVHNQGLHQASRGEEVVALVTVVIPTQAAGLP
jgi:hypothetical protein